MIRSFRNRNLQKAWEHGKTVQLKTLSANDIHYVLDALSAASVPSDVAFFGRYFEWTEGGQVRFGVAISAQWTVTYLWSEGHADDVDLEWND